MFVVIMPIASNEHGNNGNTRMHEHGTMTIQLKDERVNSAQYTQFA